MPTRGQPTVAARMPAADLDHYRAVAAERGVTVADLVRDALAAVYGPAGEQPERRKQADRRAGDRRQRERRRRRR